MLLIFLIQFRQGYCMLLNFSDSGPSGLLHAVEFSDSIPQLITFCPSRFAI